LQRISEISNKKNKTQWGTIKYLAVIDSGIRFKKDVANPATGYIGDKCVLVVRQPNSRFVSSEDEVVYYSVADQDRIFSSQILRQVVEDLIEWGISSEQFPTSLLGSESDFKKGDWNIQCTAKETHLIDFSQYFVLPHSKLSKEWKMSDEALSLSLKAGFQFNSLSTNDQLFQKAFGSNFKEKTVIWNAFISEQFPILTERFKHLGKFGLCKPAYCWSWFLEMDDSLITKMGFQSDLEWQKSIKFIDSCLP
jgi:hypothetical protein